MKELEVEINEKLKKQFADKDFNISDLKLEYDIITPTSDAFEGKGTVLTTPIVATYNTHFKKCTSEEDKKAKKLIGEVLSERLRKKGIL